MSRICWAHRVFEILASMFDRSGRADAVLMTIKNQMSFLRVFFAARNALDYPIFASKRA